MKYEIEAQGTFPVLNVTLAPGETFVSEAGAMAWMDPNVACETAARGGVMAGLSRSLLTGESFFQNTYSTTGGEGTVAFAPAQPGRIAQVEMAGRELCLEKGAYVASTPDVTIESKFDGLKGLFNEGLFVLKASGSGTMFFAGYGDLEEVQVQGEYVVDNGYAVAWDAGLEYRLDRAKKIRNFLFGDQLLLRFSGQGTVWVQSRSPYALANWVFPFRPIEQKSDDD